MVEFGFSFIQIDYTACESDSKVDILSIFRGKKADGVPWNGYIASQLYLSIDSALGFPFEFFLSSFSSWERVQSSLKKSCWPAIN